MTYLLDTCTISELIRPRPHKLLMDWLDSQDEEVLYLSTITIAEIYKGIFKNVDIGKRIAILAWLESDILTRFNNRIIPITNEVALIWGRMCGEAENRGCKLPIIDSLIAATAIVNNFIVVTRNIKDMERCNAKVLCPWEVCTV